MLNLKIIIGVTSFTLLCIILELIRRGQLKERYALLWLFTCVGVFLFSFSPKLIKLLADITGMYYLSIISFFSFMFVLLVLLHFSVVLSKLHDRNKSLTQQCALLEHRLMQLEAKREGEKR